MAEHDPSSSGSTGSSTGSSTSEQRDRWQRRATWLTQLGLSTEEPTPVDVIEEIAGAVLALLTEVRQLELERAEARAWAWSDYHRELHYDWVSVAGNTCTGGQRRAPGLVGRPRTPDGQEWWPTVEG